VASNIVVNSTDPKIGRVRNFHQIDAHLLGHMLLYILGLVKIISHTAGKVRLFKLSDA
jgi:histidyl-tRNA synthetase